MKKFSIADAKNDFTRVVKLAETGDPVYVTRRGEPAVVIVSARDFVKLSAQKANLRKAVEQWRLATVDAPLEPKKIWGNTRTKTLGRPAPFLE